MLSCSSSMMGLTRRHATDDEPVLGTPLLCSVTPTRSIALFDLTGTGQPKIAVVAAARPNFMKVGPIVPALQHRGAEVELVHTGQHYDERMSGGFFRDLGIPEPDVNLDIGSGSHAEQTAGVMVAFEAYLQKREIDAVVVVGDVNSTIACAIAAVKLGIPVAHVEAGLRSRDWNMPEEINRVLTDRISRWLFTTSADADANLESEGVPGEWVHLVGNVMIDTLLANIDRARERAVGTRADLGLDGRYGVMTLHRPSNVDEAASLQALLGALGEIASDVPLVFPTHPRTANHLKDFGIDLPAGIRLIDPLGFLDFVGLVDGASIVLTDSGGVQEETSVLGVPCLTLRENTERPVTCELGTMSLSAPSRQRSSAPRSASWTGRASRLRSPCGTARLPAASPASCWQICWPKPRLGRDVASVRRSAGERGRDRSDHPLLVVVGHAGAGREADTAVERGCRHLAPEHAVVGVDPLQVHRLPRRTSLDVLRGKRVEHVVAGRFVGDLDDRQPSVRLAADRGGREAEPVQVREGVAVPLVDRAATLDLLR